MGRAPQEEAAGAGADEEVEGAGDEAVVVVEAVVEEGAEGAEAAADRIVATGNSAAQDRGCRIPFIARESSFGAVMQNLILTDFAENMSTLRSTQHP